MASCHYFVEWLNIQENNGEVATAMRKLLNGKEFYSIRKRTHLKYFLVYLISSIFKNGIETFFLK